MRRIWNAVRVFFLTLFDREVAEKIEQVLLAPAVPAAAIEGPKPQPAPKAKPALRSEAITLLAALQREARFIDFLKEPLASYTDAQIGAAVRDVHRDCGLVLERMFAIRPLCEQVEGSGVEVHAGFDAGRYRLVGNVQGDPPFRGRLMHQGWCVTSCELPAWSGTADAARVIAPMEVEL